MILASLLLVSSILYPVSAAGLPWYSGLLDQPQILLAESHAHENPFHVFSKPIKSAAVVGAGPNGLQVAAELRDAGIVVRLFERKDGPGGNWRYSRSAPLAERFPQPPASEAAFIPDFGPQPERISSDGYTKLYNEGDGGFSLEDRLLEHSVPSSVWANLHTNSASGITHFLDSPLPNGSPWELSQWSIQRHVRSYASNHELNSNDNDINNVTSYGTRVESITKHGDTWRLTLRKLEHLPRSRQIEATWWTEEFDAVVVAAGGLTSPLVPNISGIDKWAAAYPSRVYHSRHYRRPENYANRTVLIVGASTSGSEIARDLFPHAHQVITSVKDNSTNKSINRKLAYARIPDGVLNLSEIDLFEEPKPGKDISDGIVRLKNGTLLTGIDSVILATGYVTSWPFLKQFHNDTIQGTDEPETEVAPIVVGAGKHMRSLYLGTFYLDDPTLVIASVRPWNLGPYAAVAVAKVWSGTARLPNHRRRWEEYRALARAAGGIASPQLHGVGFGAPITEYLFRKYVGWINSEAAILGGKQVDTYPREWREQWVHFALVHWGREFPISLKDFLDAEETGEAGLGKRALLAEVVAEMENY